jgi:hypothetical protein
MKRQEREKEREKEKDTLSYANKPIRVGEILLRGGVK